MAYNFSYTNNCGEKTNIRVRNVTSKNPQAALQFVIEQDRGQRRRCFCFDLPDSEIPKFLGSIQKED